MMIRSLVRESTVFRRRPGPNGTVSVTRVERPDTSASDDLPKHERLQSLGMKQHKISSGKAPNVGQLVVRVSRLEHGYGKLIDMYEKSGSYYGTIAWRIRPSGQVGSVSTDVPFRDIAKATDYYDDDDLEGMPNVSVINRASKSQFYK